MKRSLTLTFVVTVALSATVGPVYGGHTLIADALNNRVIQIPPTGLPPIWQQVGLAFPIDAERLANGNTLITEFTGGLVTEFTPGGAIAWQKGGLADPIDAERLANGNTLITEYAAGVVTEFTPGGALAWQWIGLVGPTDAERLANGNTLITEWNANRVAEYTPGGAIMWQQVGLIGPYDAERLPNGNTLIAEYSTNRVTEFTPGGAVAWQKIGVAGPTDAERLPNGNTLITERNANRVAEYTPGGAIAWQQAVGLNWPYDAERLDPVTEVWVDDDWNSQADVDGYNPSLMWQYDAFDSIQHGIDAIEGSTVHVLAGTYNQRLVVNKSLNLLGAQAGVDPTPLGARINPANESIINVSGLPPANPNIAIRIPGLKSNITIDGFTIIGHPTQPTADTCVIRCGGGGGGAITNDIRIRNNILRGRYGVVYRKGSGLRVGRNRVVVNKAGVVVQPGAAANVDITANTFRLGGSPAGDESAVYMTNTTGATVARNRASGFTGGGVRGSNLRAVFVTGNRLVGNKDAVSFWGDTRFVLIRRNRLANSTRHGINIKGRGIFIFRNLIGNNGDTGINVDRHVIDTQNVRVHVNAIVGNTNFGIKVNTATVTDIVNAEYNWWGDMSGPYDPVGFTEVPPCGALAVNWMKNADGLGNAVTDNVDYCPWLNMPLLVETLYATNVGTTSATLWGLLLFDDGEACQYRFRYHKQGDPGYVVSPWSSDTKVSGESFSLDVSGLTPGCKYYVTVKAKNSQHETGWASPKSFVTLHSLLQLEAPHGGTYAAGQRCLICWKADPTLLGRDVLMEYSTDNGVSWDTIGTVANGDDWRSYAGGHYSWYPPAVNSDQCLVRISDTTDPSIFDVSDSTFTILMQFVPDVVGLAQADAEATITGAGFVVGTVTYNYSNVVPAGEVMSQYPAAGTPATAGSAVDLAVSAGPFAAGPPTVDTEYATNIGTSSATLEGVITGDGGGACQYRFRYCKEGGPDNFTPWSSDFKTAGESFSQDVTGLDPGAKYYCWAEAKNSAGNGTGGLKSFTTLDSLLQLESPHAGIYPAGSRCLICWKADPTLGTSDVLVEYSTDNGGSWNTIATVANTDDWRGYKGGHYSWYPPSVSSDECLVRISDTSDPSIFDVSDSTFTIVP